LFLAREVFNTSVDKFVEIGSALPLTRNASTLFSSLHHLCATGSLCLPPAPTGLSKKFANKRKKKI
jgi:hypothetical protein